MSKNSHYFFRSIILLGFGLFIINLLITGDIHKFIAPRMTPYIYFALFVIIVLSVIQFFKSDSPEDEHSCDCGHSHDLTDSMPRSFLVYSLFIVPIFTGMLFSDHVLGSSQASIKGFKYELNSTSPSDSFNKPESNVSTGDSAEESDEQDLLEDPAILTPEDRYPKLYKEFSNNESLVLNEDTYIGGISILEDNADQYVGKEITMNGFVFREDSFPEDQIVIGRFGISCCVADGGIYGLLVQGGGQEYSRFKNDTWVEVTGTLKKVKHNNWELPMIEPASIKKIETPKEPYVYEELEF
ncbi:TIGR03943 family putative permease subunit [Halobacillus massiliensis]|uniref:TIGR03943 family putative permease subunit n=1 Tax=Halobacillus massiliensis TaxID=1926286 RepID=UPI0009E21F7C|nr:TIGR03943 family protein [Halobacillus massiliensis]